MFKVPPSINGDLKVKIKEYFKKQGIKKSIYDIILDFDGNVIGYLDSFKKPHLLKEEITKEELNQINEETL